MPADIKTNRTYELISAIVNRNKFNPQLDFPIAERQTTTHEDHQNKIRTAMDLAT